MKMLGANTLQNRCSAFIWKVPFHVCVIFSETKSGHVHKLSGIDGSSI